MLRVSLEVFAFFVSQDKLFHGGKNSWRYSHDKVYDQDINHFPGKTFPNRKSVGEVDCQKMKAWNLSL